MEKSSVNPKTDESVKIKRERHKIQIIDSGDIEESAVEFFKVVHFPKTPQQSTKQQKVMEKDDGCFQLHCTRLLQNKMYTYANSFFTIMMVVSIFMYSYKLQRTGQKDSYQLNQISKIIQLTCTAFFIFHLFLKVISKVPTNSQFKVENFEKANYSKMSRTIWKFKSTLTGIISDSWMVLEMIAVSCTFASLGNFEKIYYARAIKCIWLLGLAYVHRPILKTAKAIVRSFKSFATKFTLVILFVIIFSCPLQYIYRDYEFYRCRDPENLHHKDNWTFQHEIQRTCGPEQPCPQHLMCLNPVDYGVIPNEKQLHSLKFGYGLLRYKHFGFAVLTTFKAMFTTGWARGYELMLYTPILPEVTAFFHITFLCLTAYILSHILLATLLEGFLFESAIKSQRQSLISQGSLNQLEVLRKVFQSNENKVNDSESFLMRILKHRSLHCIDNFFVVASCVNLAVDYDGQPEIVTKVSTVLDQGFYIIFLLFAIIQIYKSGFKPYFKKFTNICQIGILCICTAGLIYEFSIGFTYLLTNLLAKSIRSFKYARLFVMLGTSPLLQETLILVICFFKSLRQLICIIVVWMMLVMLYTIVGYTLFGYWPIHLPSHQENFSQRINFNGLYNSLVYTFLVFYNEEWDLLMFEQYYAHGAFSVIWNICGVLIGQYVFIRLFIALFLDKFMKNLHLSRLEQRERQETVDNKIKPLDNELESDNQSVLTHHPEPKRLCDLNFIQHQPIDLSNQDSPFLIKLVEFSNKMLECIIWKIIVTIVIIISCIRFTIDSPLLNPESEYITRWNYFGHFSNFIFTLELIFNLIRFGFLIGKDSYLRRSWYNVVSFIVVFASALSYSQSHNLKIFRILDRFKILKILTFIKIQEVRDRGMKVTLKSIGKIIPKVLKLFLLFIIFLSFFALFLTKIFKSSASSCESISHQFQIKTKEQCMDYGGNWIKPVYSHSNIGQSVLQLLFFATSEGWIHYMLSVTDEVGINMNPQFQAHPYVKAFFFFFFFCGNVCMLSIFVGLSVETFQKLQDECLFGKDMNAEQKQWFKIKEWIHELIPVVKTKQPNNQILKCVYKCESGLAFNIFGGVFMAIYLISTCLYGVYPQYENYLVIIHYSMTLWIVAEIIVDIVYYQRRILKNPRFYFNLAVVTYTTICFVVIKAIHLQKQQKRIIFGVSILLQVCRVVRYVKRFPVIGRPLTCLTTVIPHTINILLLILTLLYIYAIIGMEMFAYLRFGQQLNEHINYHTFSHATYSLLKFATLQGPMTQLQDAMTTLNSNSVCFQISSYSDFEKYGFMGCGSPYAVIYFLSYHVALSMMLLMMLVAVVLDAYKEAYQREVSAVSDILLNQILELWSEFDPEGSKCITYRDFWVFATKVAKVCGLGQAELRNRRGKKEFQENLHAQIYEDTQTGQLCFEFHNVLQCLLRVTMEIKYKKKGLDAESKKKQQRCLIKKKTLHKHLTSTPYFSSDMMTILFLKAGLKNWRNKAIIDVRLAQTKIRRRRTSKI